MSEQYQVGDLVECIDATSGCGYWEPGCDIREGGLYTVTGLHTTSDGEHCLRLKEIERGPQAIADHSGDCGFGARRFRKVYHPKADLITRLTERAVDAPAREVVSA